jgi:hypothetical protein
MIRALLHCASSPCFVTCLVDLMRPNIGFSSDVTREAHESALKPRSAWLCAGTS